MWDPSRLPRHKVCGEFLSPEVEPVLRSLGLWSAYEELRPARMDRMRLVFGKRESSAKLPSPAFGVSRYALDLLLRESAERAGAQLFNERVGPSADIVAHGRQASAEGRDRLFGFKAHFEGPPGDAVELFFSDGFYCGVNTVEGGVTNVCGLAAEPMLRTRGFDYDEVINRNEALRERLAPMRRTAGWLSTGPVVFQPLPEIPPSESYLAGDALQFVDPFTGTGMTIALWTGTLAGKYAALGRAREEYYAEVREGLKRQFQWCGWLRRAMQKRWPLAFAPLVPPGWFYRATRPSLSRT